MKLKEWAHSRVFTPQPWSAFVWYAITFISHDNFGGQKGDAARADEWVAHDCDYFLGRNGRARARPRRTCICVHVACFLSFFFFVNIIVTVIASLGFFFSLSLFLLRTLHMATLLLEVVPSELSVSAIRAESRRRFSSSSLDWSIRSPTKSCEFIINAINFALRSKRMDTIR